MRRPTAESCYWVRTLAYVYWMGIPSAAFLGAVNPF